ncbi:hypothetical protein B0H17DRAFT_1140616 [Mycena rosella]|uniref:Uncharacterized protein n=1 Tax=Mycena rosella TaxID=1033263 RepID=A0AAD7D231_MYCRO|nr:hypothetical protein B0H17DRAFT_1140616 [Mycena rosella]
MPILAPIPSLMALSQRLIGHAGFGQTPVSRVMQDIRCKESCPLSQWLRLFLMMEWNIQMIMTLSVFSSPTRLLVATSPLLTVHGSGKLIIHTSCLTNLSYVHHYPCHQPKTPHVPLLAHRNNTQRCNRGDALEAIPRTTKNGAAWEANKDFEFLEVKEALAFLQQNPNKIWFVDCQWPAGIDVELRKMMKDDYRNNTSAVLEDFRPGPPTKGIPGNSTIVTVTHSLIYPHSLKLLQSYIGFA